MSGQSQWGSRRNRESPDSYTVLLLLYRICFIEEVNVRWGAEPSGWVVVGTLPPGWTRLSPGPHCPLVCSIGMSRLELEFIATLVASRGPVHEVP